MQFTRKTLKNFLTLLPGVAPRERSVLLACIGIALVFWLIVNLARDYTVTTLVAIDYQLPEDELLSEPPQRVLDLTVRGQGWNLLWASLKKTAIELSVSVAELPEGRLSKGDIAKMIERQISSGKLEIIDLNFNATDLQTVKKATKKVPLQLDLAIAFAPGYTAFGPLLQSLDSVLISGPITALDTIDSWTTLPHQKEHISRDFLLSLPLQIPSPPLQLLSEEEVSIQQKVEALTERSVFVPVHILNPPKRDSLSIFPMQIRLKVNVAQSNYHSIQPDSFRLVVDLQSIGQGERSSNLPLLLLQQPSSALSVSFTPKTVEYFLFSKR